MPQLSARGKKVLAIREIEKATRFIKSDTKIEMIAKELANLGVGDTFAFPKVLSSSIRSLACFYKIPYLQSMVFRCMRYKELVFVLRVE